MDPMAMYGTMLPNDEWDQHEKCEHCGQPKTAFPENYPLPGEDCCPKCGQIYWVSGIPRP